MNMEDHILNHVYNNYRSVDIIADGVICGSINCIYLESISQKYRTMVKFEGDSHKYRIEIDQSKSLVKMFVKLVNNKFEVSINDLSYTKYLRMYYIFNELLLSDICYNRYFEAYRICKSDTYKYNFLAAFFYYDQHYAPFDNKLKLLLNITPMTFSQLTIQDSSYNFGSVIMIDYFVIKYNLSDHRFFTSNIIMILEQCLNSMEKIKHLTIDQRYQLFMYFYDRIDKKLITDEVINSILCMFCGIFTQLTPDDLK